MNIFLLYPIHLFTDINKTIKEYKIDQIYLIEEPRYFTDFNYHKLKLAYHRATMKSFFDNILKKIKLKKEYIELNDTDTFYKKLKSSNNYYLYSVGDDVLETKLRKIFKRKSNSKFNIIDSLNFTINKDLIIKNKSIFYNEKNKKYNFMNFYKWQRERLDILMTKEKKPIGGKWSFDEENRKKLPKSEIPNDKKMIIKESKNKYIKEAIDYINNHPKFQKSYGILTIDNFIYPIDNSSSKKWLKRFIEKRFAKFGLYEDAETDKSNFIYHSVLSPMMNVGILTDKEILKIVQYKDLKKRIPLNSFEGFIRQIIGWRNYIYAVYLLEGSGLKKMNVLKHTKKINEKMMWFGKTGIKPIDFIMNKINNYSYAHHIERLMYLGNFMLLCQINPNQVYKLFMEWTIDAYEWVMVPNVYSMSQYADGGKMMTRPYFSSSNYILLMSDYKCNNEKNKTLKNKNNWCEIWNILYYYFIYKHRELFKKNYAIAQQVKNWDRKSKSEKNNIIKEAKRYLAKYCTSSLS